MENATPASRQEMETQLHFSYSQLNAYLVCAAKYAHSYVWGTPWETKAVALLLGKAIHKGAETFYRALMETGEIISAEQLVEAFTSVFDEEVKNTEVEITYKDGETSQSVREQGIELLTLFHKEIRPQQIASVEFPFSVSIPDISNGGNLPIRLVGFLDVVERDQDGTYLIGELKTSSQRYSGLRLTFDNQATVYSYAMKRMALANWNSSCLIRYDTLLKLKKPAFEQYYVARTEADHLRLIQLINHVLRAIEARVFYRNTGWACSDCQFRKACFA